VVFADIDQLPGVASRAQALVLFYVDFVDSTFGIVHDGEETFAVMLHWGTHGVAY
jgi:hypothetical protein